MDLWSKILLLDMLEESKENVSKGKNRLIRYVLLSFYSSLRMLLFVILILTSLIISLAICINVFFQRIVDLLIAFPSSSAAGTYLESMSASLVPIGSVLNSFFILVFVYAFSTCLFWLVSSIVEGESSE
ncbi:hypothetical protein HZC07_01285 [Candidatus Micrarchaeota archaeon]|nr:hypothetical protein [Candidatus Micrarchaeota archaeon]